MATSKSNYMPVDQSTTAPSTTIIRNLPWTYLHLTLISSSTIMSASSTPAIDALTARSYLTSALQRFLGLAGTAISIDFLKVDGRDIWIRVPREDGAAVVGAVNGWVGMEGVAWRIRGKSEWLGGLVAGDGRELFEA